MDDQALIALFAMFVFIVVMGFCALIQWAEDESIRHSGEDTEHGRVEP